MSATTADDGHADDTGPDYYKAMTYAPWEAMQAILTPEEWRGYLKGSLIKYAMRQGRKLGAPDDADKARHYARKLAEIMRE